MNRRALSLLLVLGLLLLSACQGADQTQPSPSPSPSAMPQQSHPITPLHIMDEEDAGGYRETYIKPLFPISGYGLITLMQNGDLMLYDKDWDRPMELCRYNLDTGIIEKPEGYAWLEEEGDFARYSKSFIQFFENGDILGILTNQYVDSQTLDFIEDPAATSKLFRGNADGFHFIDLPNGLESISASSCVCISPNNQYYALLCYEGDAYIFDAATDACISSVQFAYSPVYSKNVCLIGNQLAYITYANMGKAQVVLHDVLTGEELASHPVTDAHERFNFLPICAQNDESAILFASSTGVYRVDIASGEQQKVLDGRAYMLSDPALNLDGIHHLSDGRLLIQYFSLAAGVGSSASLCLYAYSDEPAGAADALRVFSLHESDSIRGAVSRYKEEFAGAQIEYTVGAEGGISTGDAITTLTADLLAGKGPDILVLDGLPVSSYAQKGALLNLQMLLNDDLLSGISRAFQGEDGTVYAIPSRFCVPAIYGKDVSQIGSLQALATWLERCEHQDIGIGPKKLMDHFFDIYAGQWIENGALNAELFAADLQAMGQIAQLWRETSVRPPQYEDNDPSFMVFEVFAGMQAASLGRYGSARKLIEPYSGLKQSGTEFCFFGDDVFIPSAILGVNAASGKALEALTFVEFALDQTAQGQDYGDGFPVSSAALEQQLSLHSAREGGDKPTGTQEINWYDSNLSFDLYDLTAQQVEDFIKKVRGLNACAPTNSALKSIFIDETSGYLIDESKSLEETLQALESKLALYMAE